MKKLVLVLLFAFIATTAYGQARGSNYDPITVDPFVTPDDVTIPHLEDFRTAVVNHINDFPGGNIQLGTISPDQLSGEANPVVRWNEAFSNWVYTGLGIPISGGSLTENVASGVGYVNGVRIANAAEAITFPATEYSFVDINTDGTYTVTSQVGATPEPAIAAGRMRIGRVLTDGSQITAFRDDRIWSISLDSNQSDNWRTGMLISATTPDTITISPGVAYNGTIRIQKTTNTALDVTNAGDWTVGGQGTAQMSFVILSTTGVLSLSNVAPSHDSTAGGTAGQHRYVYYNANYYRALNWFYLNSIGSGDLEHGYYSNIKDGDAPNIIIVTGDNDITTASGTYVDMEDMTSYFYSSGRPIQVTQSMPLGEDSGAGIWVSTNIDGVNETQTHSLFGGSAGGRYPFSMTYSEILARGTKTIKTQWRATNIATQPGKTSGQRVMIVEEK